MVDIELVKKELIPPEIYLRFSANYGKKNSFGVYAKNAFDVYVMNACTGDVYKECDKPKPKTDKCYCLGNYTWLKNGGSVFNTAFQECTNETRVYALQWQYIAKYDVIALIQWATPNIPFFNSHNGGHVYVRGLKITDCPNIGIVSKDKDPNAIFRWALDTNTIDIMAMVVIDKEKNIEYRNFFGHEWHNLMRKDNFFSDKYPFGEHYEKHVLEDFFDVVFIGDNQYSLLDGQDAVKAFFKAKDPKYIAGPKQKKLDELLNIPLKNPKTDSQVSEVSSSYFLYSYCYVSRVNNKWAVVRWFKQFHYYISGKDCVKYVEVYRLYVSKTEHFFCRLNVGKKFVLFSSKIKPDTFGANKVFFENGDVLKDTKLEYLPALNKLDNRYISSIIYMFMTYPEFEKLLKSGFAKLCSEYVEWTWDTKWYDWLKQMFGTVDIKARGLNQIIGLNKHQIEKISPIASRKFNERIVKDLKDVFGMDDLRDLDTQSFDTVFDLYMKIESKRNFEIFQILEATTSLYSYKVMVKVAANIREILDQNSSCPCTINTYNTIHLYRDILSMIRTLGIADRIKPYFKDETELQNAHDTLVDAVNLTSTSNQWGMSNASIEKFEQRKKVWQKWEYNENSQYIVVAPQSAVDIAEEGIALHHCVRTYIPKVVNGETNIMFVRKKDTPDTPFFTIEVLNNNEVRQIHGMCNCNVSSESGLTEFIEEWANAVGVRINSYDQCLCA